MLALSVDSYKGDRITPSNWVYGKCVNGQTVFPAWNTICVSRLMVKRWWGFLFCFPAAAVSCVSVSVLDLDQHVLLSTQQCWKWIILSCIQRDSVFSQTGKPTRSGEKIKTAALIRFHLTSFEMDLFIDRWIYYCVTVYHMASSYCCFWFDL